MVQKEDDFLKKLLATFRIEAADHLKALTSGILRLEKTPNAQERKGIIEAIFREAHSLKGAARAVNMTEIEAACRSMENVFAALKEEEIPASPKLLDLLHQAVDHLAKSVSSSGAQNVASEGYEIRRSIQRLEGVLQGRGEEAQEPEPERQGPEPKGQEATVGGRLSGGLWAPSPDTVRIPAAKLDSLLHQVEEFVGSKLAMREFASELKEANGKLAEWKNDWAKIHPDARLIQHSLERNTNGNGHGHLNRPLAKLLDFLARNDSRIKSLESDLVELAKSAEQAHRSVGAMVDNLLEDMKQVLMHPFSSILEPLPKLVRDLSRDRGKEVELVVKGGEIEIDKRILEEMKDPLIHLMRNCVDHGIEKPSEREKKNKSRRGTVTVAVAQKEGGKVEILVSDDGGGIDVGKVRASVSQLGVVAKEDAERMDDKQAVSLIFQSGVSTSPMITDISGRGLGLAIVREKAEKLGGIASLETSETGTTVRMVLPLTLATFRGVLVRANEGLFVVPTVYLDRVLRVKTEEIQTVENRETIQVGGQTVSVVRLRDVLELPSNGAGKDSSTTLPALVLGSADRRIAYLVDEVLGEQEVLVKTLGPQLSRVRNVAGATVLSTGDVVPILSVPDLIKSGVRASIAGAGAREAPTVAEQASKGKSVLVVEDSITARTLVKSILEGAGYDVKTAVDGLDGFTQLRSAEFDIVVSDVDMPRMNGFDLTAKIRADKKLSELPVILVTALESREDRERGIDVGANAYIVKSSFDQSNLLEAIRRLV